MEYMRGINAPSDLRDILIDREIIPKLVKGELVANPIPVAASPTPPPSSPVQSKPVEAEEGYMEPFIPVSFSPRREEVEARVETHVQYPQAVRFSKL